MNGDDMHGHRMIGAGLVSLGLVFLSLVFLGLALLAGRLALLYGSASEQAMMVAIGLRGVAVLSATGAACFSCGCLLAAAPHATVHHPRRITVALRRRRS